MSLFKDDIIFNTIDNGILILDKDLKVKAWNKWLKVKTSIEFEEIHDKDISDVFTYIDHKKLKRKIKSVLITKNPAYFNVEPHKYLIKIKSNIVLNSIYKFMRQDVTIVPYDIEKGYVCLYISDQTKLYENSAKLKKLNQELKDISSRDGLTHLFNRRYFAETSKSLENLAIRNNHNICIIILDVDNFKNINDSFGHSVGDDAIRSVARILENNCRKSDVVARYGGEEFIILLYNTTLNFAESIAENIRINIEEFVLKAKKTEVKFTTSLGVAQYNTLTDGGIEATISRADKALYVSKKSGKNKTTIDT